MLLLDQKDELEHLVPHIGNRPLTIKILKEVLKADKEKVCTIYNTFSFSIEVHYPKNILQCLQTWLHIYDYTIVPTDNTSSSDVSNMKE